MRGGRASGFRRSAVSPRWFCDFSGSKATSPDSNAKAHVKPLTAPFGTDDSASWDRDKCCPDKQKVTGAAGVFGHPFHFSFLPSSVYPSLLLVGLASVSSNLKNI